MTFKDFKNRLSISLNDQQWEAVRAVEGPILLIAVPGSGKTTVLVTRIGFLIGCCGIPSQNILTITYTKAAAADMKRRFAAIFSAKMAERLSFQTINSLCFEIIHRSGQMDGVQVASEKDILEILTGIFQKYIGDYPTESDLQSLQTQISYIKNMMLGNDEIRKLGDNDAVPLLRIFEDYNSLLHQSDRMDFDDQMVYAYQILRQNPQLLSYYQHKYRYFCVDEAQDTSKIQHIIIALLASKDRNLFMVGDEDQSIYGFRAAYPDALLHFEQDHPGARVLYMERNYRSDANIVQAADRFISQNILRHKKSMLPTKPGTIAVQTIALKSRGAQYSYLGKVAADCQTETAVLYRYNESVLPLVDLLERKEIPYRIRNADFSFFKSRIVRDITDILSLSIDPCDTGRFMRVYYKMKLFLKKEEATKACQESQQRDLPILEAAIRFVDCSPQKKRQLQDQQRLLQKLGQERGDRAIRQVVNDLGYGEYLERNHMNDRKVLLLQLLGKNEASPADFLNRLDYLNQILQEKAPDPDCPFILSTIHSSKGLEYETVFLMDAADGIFPETIPQSLKRMDPKERQEYEEERRLFYVGVTRAKSRLFLFSFGRKSSFIEQLLKKKNDAAPKPPEKRKATKRPAYGRQRTYSKPIVSEEALLEFVRSLGEGIIVTHKKYGKGAVSALSDKQVVIHFDAGDKTFDLSALYASKTLEIE